ncbi:MAG: DNA repair protein RecO [Simplicispira suum]|uniref:DNA repair protein RecO n=1 Tax=Simplicispira suum TaxID=2109915 RepID=UPI001C6B9531|nr:DNA repair protein RecO [Simplicispira suum]MBW7834499.1 DNA repair protein RecO [Simplicispira suum]
MPPRRFSNEPAFVLHRYDWSESSLILEVFTRNHGRTALVAKGAKKPSSNFRPVLLPLQPLHLGWTQSAGGEAEIHTLKGAEWVGGHIMPTGDALLSGLYMNELLLRLLARGDPHAFLFDHYAAVVQVLASEHGEALEPVLRLFELVLLREVGLLPALDVQTLTQHALDPAGRYALVAEVGLRTAGPDERASLRGAQWLLLAQALQEGAALTALLHACAPVAFELKPQLRALLQYHCGSPRLRTRQFMMDVQAL